MIQERLGNTGQHDHPVSRFSTYGSGDRRASLGGGSRGSRRTTCTCVYTQWRENTGGWLTSPGKFFTFSLLLILIFHLPLLVPRVRTSFIDVVFLVQFVIVRYANRSIDTGRVQSFSDRDTDMGTGAILDEPAIGMREKRVDAKLYREDEVCNDFSCARNCSRLSTPVQDHDARSQFSRKERERGFHAGTAYTSYTMARTAAAYSSRLTAVTSAEGATRHGEAGRGESR
ncbi:uncharacterized protein LOC102653910 [Apis mellifera]|uniref:Uncharacterized protein LOC102653910 n=1 Tax=Apis mellifera TaxID=7460 RepID=A0A7M7GPH7_APIME|nr:uncharacterized protein LOC102653910 [Apis mellifera]|eukprot:XP_006562537.2 uncharacterized protein LOC102653910 [Apis mellifera]